MPIRYKINILTALKDTGYSTYKLRQSKTFGERTIQKFRDGEVVTADNLAKLCELLNCQPGDILEYVSDGTVASENTPINKQPVISDDIIQTRAKEDRAVQTAPPKARTRREISDSQLMEIANRLKNEKQDNTIKPLDNS